VEEAMVRGGCRTLHDVNTAVVNHFELSPKNMRQVKPILQKSYDTMVQRIVGAIVLNCIKEGREDLKTINAIVRKERYSVDDSVIIEIMREQKKAHREAVSQRAKDRIQAQKDAQGNLTDDPEKRQAALELYKDKLRASVNVTLSKQKEKHVSNILTRFRLEYLREIEQDEKRVMIHRGNYRSREVFLKTVYEDEDSENVENVVLLFRRVSGTKKLTLSFDLEKIHTKWAGEDGFAACKKNLLTLNKVLDFKDFQSLIWFLGLILENADDIPSQVIKLMEERFYPYIRQVEHELASEFVNEIVEKKYYQMMQQ